MYSNYNLLLDCAADIKTSQEWMEMKNTLLIIDEAQGSYEYESLWSDFFRIQADSRKGGIIVLLLSSFGSPSATPVHLPRSAPTYLSPAQRVSIRPLSENNPKVSLYFTRAEFDDLVDRICNFYKVGGQPFDPSPELVDYIWEFLNGHPGGTRTVLEALVHSGVSCAFLVRIPSN